MTEKTPWQPGMPLQVFSEHFMLRSLMPNDADDVYTSWWNDAELQRGFNAPPRNWSRERAAKHIASFNNKTRLHLGIFDKESGHLIGFFAIFINYRQKLAKTNVLIGDRAYWGKGVVLEIRTRLMDFLFRRLEMDKVEGEVVGRNLSSIYNYKALGFTPEGVRRKQVVSTEGGRTDVYHFGMLREDWLARRQAENVA